MEHKQEIIISRGIPGSGKSSWAENWVREDPMNRVKISRDDIRYALSKQETGRAQWFVMKEDGNVNVRFENKVTEIQRQLETNALKNGKSIVSDNTNLTQRATRDLLRESKNRNIPLVIKDFPIDLEEAVRRDAKRDKKVGREVIERMYKSLGPNGEFPHIDGTLELQKFVPPTKKRKKAIGFDMDGTLVDVRPVTHHINTPGQKKNWDLFHRHSLFCPPNEEVVKLLKKAQAEGYAILITTARVENYAEVSQQWLKDNGIEFDNYYCRKRGDFRTDYEVKKDMYNNISQHYDLVHQVDDNPQAIDAWEENDVLVTKVEFGPSDGVPLGQLKPSGALASGGCLRCGKPLSKGTIGPRCAQKGR